MKLKKAIDERDTRGDLFGLVLDASVGHALHVIWGNFLEFTEYSFKSSIRQFVMVRRSLENIVFLGYLRLFLLALLAHFSV